MGKRKSRGLKDVLYNLLLIFVKLLVFTVIILPVFHELGHVIYQLVFGIPITIRFETLSAISTAPLNWYAGLPYHLLGSTTSAILFSLLTYPIFLRLDLFHSFQIFLSRIGVEKWILRYYQKFGPLLWKLFWLVLVINAAQYDISNTINFFSG
jgi:hypothetical protein